jgi:predicted nucleotidyltransferase
MQTKHDYLRKLRQFKQQYSEEYGIERIGIFGSVARGEESSESDVDIYFESNKKLSLFRMGGLMYDLKASFGVPVDIVHNTGRLPVTFKQRIEKEIVYV